MTFLRRLRNIQRSHRSLLCVGLDVDPDLIPRHLHTYGNPVIAFTKVIIDATADLVCAYKLNLAFYEALAERGWDTLRYTLEAIPEGIITIGDGKRGDIGYTSERYATALYDELGFDAVTVNPYMGYDSVAPFLTSISRCAFVLTLTSNEGSSDFQRLRVDGRPLYQEVVRHAIRWNRKKNVGLVVGATHPEELQTVRALAPELPMLIPGIGKQGGDLRAAVRFGCTKNGDLALINASRSIIYASPGKDFAKAARREAARLRAHMERLQGEYFS